MGGMPKVLELKEWFPNLPTTKISHQRAPATKHRHTIFRNIYIPKKWKLIIQIQSYNATREIYVYYGFCGF